MKKLIVCLVIFGLMGWSAWGVRFYKFSHLKAKEVSWAEVDQVFSDMENLEEKYIECLAELSK